MGLFLDLGVGLVVGREGEGWKQKVLSGFPKMISHVHFSIFYHHFSAQILQLQHYVEIT